MTAPQQRPSIYVTLLALAALLALGGCNNDDDGGTSPSDTTPPATVTDLAVQTVGANSVTLRWTTPGDDGATGSAATYDLRYMTGEASAFVFGSATSASGLPTPKVAGTVETSTVSGLTAGTTYSFALRTADEKPNWASVSNVVSANVGGGSAGCSVTPASLDFGSVTVGSTADRTFTFSNTGDQPLSGTVAGAVAPFSITSGGGAYTLAAGQSRAVTVRYAPAAAGTHTATIDTGSGDCADVPCTGTATSASAGCSVTPQTLMFPLTGVHEFTVSQFIIRNTGTNAISGSVTSGCTTFEVMTGGGAYTLAPGQQRLVIVRFRPSAEGVYSCVIDTGLSDCADVTCSGTCGELPPGCTVNPTSLLFPDTPAGSSLDLSFTITNDTEAAISGNISTTSAVFSVVSGGGAYTLQPAGMLTATVRYAPMSHGAHAGVIHTGLPCIDVGCAGTSVGEHPDCFVYPLVLLDFAPRAAGTWEEKVFNIQNLGTGTLTGTVGSATAPFQITSGQGSYALTTGQIHSVTVRFAPTGAGTWAGEIDTGTSCTNVACIGIGLAGGDQPACNIQPASLTFPATAVGSQSDLAFSITNSGTGTLTGDVQESCAAFSITSGGGSYSLAAEQSRTVTVRFAPTTAGDAQCDVSTGATCTAVHCTGTGTQETPGCTVVPTSLTFPATGVGSEVDLSFTISNSGAGSLSGIVTENCPHFEIIEGNGAYDLAAGASRTVTVRFAPQAEGVQTCAIDLGSSCVDVGCTGTGTSVPEDMVLIPAGTFTMGSDLDEGAEAEEPEHTPYISAYYIDKYEVSNARYAEALNYALAHGLVQVVNDTEPNGIVQNGPGHGDEPFLFMDYQSWDVNQCWITFNGTTFGVESGWENYPVVYVSWYGAAAYCNWRSAMSGRTPCYNVDTWECNFAANGYRLPTEAEWEKAARGSTDERVFPWGDTIDCDVCNYSPDINLCLLHPVEVDDPDYADGASPYGVWHLGGNVWEFCNDIWDADYYATSPATDPRGPATGELYRVSRGGSWWDGEFHERCANRLWDAMGDTFDRLGFRTARNP